MSFFYSFELIYSFQYLQFRLTPDLYQSTKIELGNFARLNFN